MPSPLLTKTDFKACMDCRTKLYYRKNRYPSNVDDNEYVRFLADGGFMVEFIAKARFPGAADLTDVRDPNVAFERTKALLTGGDITLFEAAANSGMYHVRTDILQRVGNVLHLIEVKSSSLDEEQVSDVESPFLAKQGKNKGKVSTDWRPYLMDVAFQAYVLQLAFPQFTVKPKLCLIDKSNPVTAAETLDRFTLEKNPANPKARPKVSYKGDLAELAKSKMLCFRSVENEVAMLMPEVEQKAKELAGLLNGRRVTRVDEDISKLYRQCRVCEYRLKTGEPNGFRECWGALADAKPHVLDLYQITRIPDSENPIPALLKHNRASVLDLQESDLGKDGSPLQKRRFMQWDALRKNSPEHLPTALKNELREHQRTPGWPLHFLDFEACNIALPHHAGLRPYERIAFQWSCHTLHADGKMTHREWLNTERDFPNFAFADSLRKQLGDKGAIYVWSSYEQATLNNVLRQIETWLQRNADEAVRLSGLKTEPALNKLAGWIDDLLGFEDEKGKRHDSPRIRDLHHLAKEYYFHPRMGGRTSIKVVLPAVWETDSKLWEHPDFKEYFERDEAGKIKDPYKVLPELPLGDEDDREDAVRDGTGAIRIYQDLIFASDTSAKDFEARRQLLLQYCKLDTAAMVMIWRHWMSVY